MAITSAELFDINGNSIKFELLVGADDKNKIQLLSSKSKSEYFFYIKSKKGKIFTKNLLLNR